MQVVYNVPPGTTLVQVPKPPEKEAAIKKDVTEFKRRVPRERKYNWDCNWKWLDYLRKVPLWLWLTLLGLLGLAAAAFFSSVLGVYFCGAQQYLRPLYTTGSQVSGAACSSTSHCILNAYCVKSSAYTVGTCACASTYYYNSVSKTCLARKSNGIACTATSECLTTSGLTCIAGFCGCAAATYFYNTTSLRCQYLKAYQFC